MDGLDFDRGSVKSPCIGVCRIDGSGYCMGCLRTLQEIASWSSCGTKTQRIILANVESRKEQPCSAGRPRNSLVSPSESI